MKELDVQKAEQYWGFTKFCSYMWDDFCIFHSVH